MFKYYIALFLGIGIVLYYIFLQDPCYKQFTADFTSKYPDYEILFSGAGKDAVAGEESAGNVHCHVSYQKPDSKQVYEDIWLYQDSGSGWEFSEILSTQMRQQMPQ